MRTADVRKPSTAKGKDRRGSKNVQALYLRITWDAGNGATGRVMRFLTDQLPGRHVLLNEIIDGEFPSHHPDPTIPENLQELIEVVKEQKAEVAALTTETKELRTTVTQQNAKMAEQEDRMLQMEMALAEVLRNQTSGVQVSSIN